MKQPRKLMSVREWIEFRFENDPPAEGTVRRFCAKGEIPAKKICGRWFIDAEAEMNQTGEPEVDALIDMVVNG